MTPHELNLIILEVCKKENFPSDIRNIFISLKGDQTIFNTITEISNQYQNSNNDLLYDLILHAYQKSKKFFYPALKYNVHNAIFDTARPRLCLGLHSEFSPLTALLLRKKLDFIVVSDFPGTIQKVAFSSGIRAGHIKLINANESCLLNAKYFLQKNYLVSSTIDFKSKFPGPYNRLSEGMLRLAASFRPATFFGINVVDEIGQLNYFSLSLNLDRGVEKVKSEVIDFIANTKYGANFQFGIFDHERMRNLFKILSQSKHL